ncbi:hypothetical protein GGH95_001714, partial [Coemansia sp. RSA 1836]
QERLACVLSTSRHAILRHAIFHRASRPNATFHRASHPNASCLRAILRASRPHASHHLSNRRHANKRLVLRLLLAQL